MMPSEAVGKRTKLVLWAHHRFTVVFFVPPKRRNMVLRTLFIFSDWPQVSGTSDMRTMKMSLETDSEKRRDGGGEEVRHHLPYL